MITVTAAILCIDNKILLARRNSGSRHAGKWEFPGGKVEPGESPEECLAREIREEFTIDVEVNEFFAESVHDYDHGKIRLLSYCVSWKTGEMVPKDHDQVAWVSPDKLLEYDLLPADIPIARACGARFSDT